MATTKSSGLQVDLSAYKALKTGKDSPFWSMESMDNISNSKFTVFQNSMFHQIMEGLSHGKSWKETAKELNTTLSTMDRYSQEWLGLNMAPVYGMGWYQSAKALGLTPGPKVAFSVPHQQAISLMIDNAGSKFKDIKQTIGRRVDDIIRDVTVQAARDRLAGGAVPSGMGEAEARIAKDLKDNGLTAFTDKAGRKWDLETYANMSLRTIQMEAYIQGSVNKYVEEGVDYVEVGGADPVPGVSSEAAFEYFGKILCLSGADSRFDSLAMAEDAGLMHPNNWRDLLPLTKEEVDGAAAALGLEKEVVSNDYPMTSLGTKGMFVSIGGDDKGQQAVFSNYNIGAREKVISFGQREKIVILEGLPEKDMELSNSKNMKAFVVEGVSQQFDLLRPDSLTDEQMGEVCSALRDLEDFAGSDGKQYANMYNKEENADQMNITNMLTHEWANTSDSGDTLAIAMQERAEELFGIKADYKHWGDGREYPDLADRVSELMQTPGMKDTIDTFLKSQYMNTQMMFEEKGITEITLFRGFSVPNSQVSDIFGKGIDSGQANLLLQPLSSFALKMNTAEGFASAHPGETSVVIAARVPVDRIIGTFSTGYGCLSESEMVVMGAQTEPDKVFFSLGRSGTYNSGRQAGDAMAELLVNDVATAQTPEATLAGDALAEIAGLPQTSGGIIVEALKINPDKTTFILDGTAPNDEKLAYLQNIITEQEVLNAAANMQMKDAEKIAFTSDFMSEAEVWNAVHENPDFVMKMTGLTNTGYIDYLENITNSKTSSLGDKVQAQDMLNKLSKAGVHWIKGG